MTNHNGNFCDPVGLVLRMLASGNRAAYSALIREAMRYGAIPFDACLQRMERRYVSSDSDRPVLLIVGAPRSGTTLVYQALAHYLDVAHPSNLTSMFPRSPVTAARAMERFRFRRPPKFRNFYGQTSRLSDCNDAFEIWNRWLGEDRYRPVEQLSPDLQFDMNRFFQVWTNTFGKPFLNKNNRNTLAVALLAKVMPTTHFIVVRRNPVHVAQSLITARRKIQGDARTGWGLQSESQPDADHGLAHVDAVCAQVQSIDIELNRQLDTVSCDRRFEMTYEGFCESPQEVISALVRKFPEVHPDTRTDLSRQAAFEKSSRRTVSVEEYNRICERLECLNRKTQDVPLPVLATGG